MLLRSLSLALLLLGSAAWADVQTIESCSPDLSQISADTQIICDGDLHFAPHSQITLNSFELHVYVSGQIDFGSELLIQASDEAVFAVSARMARGRVVVQGGEVQLAYGSTQDYDHELLPALTASATMTRNGELVALSGPMLKPTP